MHLSGFSEANIGRVWRNSEQRGRRLCVGPQRQDLLLQGVWLLQVRPQEEPPGGLQLPAPCLQLAGRSQQHRRGAAVQQRQHILLQTRQLLQVELIHVNIIYSNIFMPSKYFCQVWRGHERGGHAGPVLSTEHGAVVVRVSRWRPAEASAGGGGGQKIHPGLIITLSWLKYISTKYLYLQFTNSILWKLCFHIFWYFLQVCHGWSLFSLGHVECAHCIV